MMDILLMAGPHADCLDQRNSGRIPGQFSLAFASWARVNRGHAPAPELSLERIRMRQSLGERLLGRGH